LLILPESLPVSRRRVFDWSRANPVGSLLALQRYPVLLGLTATVFLVHLAHGSLQSTWVLYTGYRYGWGPGEVGGSLAVIGLMAAVVQGGLVRVIIPRLGERRAIVAGLSMSALTFLGYGLATEGWMIYVIIVVGSFGAIGGPAVQALISKGVPINEQGALQGALSSLTSVAGIIGPVLATRLFGYFISEGAVVVLPGAAFFLGALLVLAGLALALASFGRALPGGVQPAEPPTRED
jgi:DHA1 family tetracycline resistance protein-like MFS transporter